MFYLNEKQVFPPEIPKCFRGVLLNWWPTNVKGNVFSMKAARTEGRDFSTGELVGWGPWWVNVCLELGRGIFPSLKIWEHTVNYPRKLSWPHLYFYFTETISMKIKCRKVFQITKHVQSFLLGPLRSSLGVLLFHEISCSMSCILCSRPVFFH